MISLFFITTFPYLIFIVAIFGVIVNFLTSFLSYQKEKKSAGNDIELKKNAKKQFILSAVGLSVVIGGLLLSLWESNTNEQEKLESKLADSKFKVKTERRRAAEYKNLKNLSDKTVDSTKAVLEDTENLLKENKGLLKNTAHLLVKADTTIKGMSEMIRKQVTTINYLVGTDSIPKLIIQIEPYLGSFSHYVLGFYVSVNDDFPIRELSVVSLYSSDKNTAEMFKNVKSINDAKVVMAKNTSMHVKDGPFTVYGHETKLIKSLILPFSLEKENTFYAIHLTWNKGTMHFNGNLTIDDYLPSFSANSLFVNDIPVDPQKPKYRILFITKIGPSEQRLLKFNREIESRQK
jgi:hypothetical protein